MKKGFSVEALVSQSKSVSEAAAGVLDKLGTVEEQVIELVGIMKSYRYLSIENIKEMLDRQEIDSVSLENVAAFLSGYLAAETYDSHFDCRVFGSMSMMEGKDIIVGSSLVALINLIDKTGITKLPDRRKPISLALVLEETSNDEQGKEDLVTQDASETCPAQGETHSVKEITGPNQEENPERNTGKVARRRRK